MDQQKNGFINIGDVIREDIGCFFYLFFFEARNGKKGFRLWIQPFYVLPSSVNTFIPFSAEIWSPITRDFVKTGCWHVTLRDGIFCPRKTDIHFKMKFYGNENRNDCVKMEYFQW